VSRSRRCRARRAARRAPVLRAAAQRHTPRTSPPSPNTAPPPCAEAQEFSKKFEEAKAINAELLGVVVGADSDDEEEEKAVDELAKEVAEKL
jgi:hypothetical protein